MKLLVSLLIVAFSGIAVARSTSLAKPIAKHRKEMWLKKAQKMIALTMVQHVVTAQAGVRMLSTGERRMRERSKERRIRELSSLARVRRSISAPDRHMWVPHQAKHLKSLSAPDRHIRELLQDDRRMRLESQLATFIALLKSPIALGALIGTIDLTGGKHPRLVYFEDSAGGGSNGMPDYRRGSGSSRHPSEIHNDQRRNSGPDGIYDGPVDSPPSSGKKNSSPDDRPSKK